MSSFRELQLIKSAMTRDAPPHIAGPFSLPFLPPSIRIVEYIILSKGMNYVCSALSYNELSDPNSSQKLYLLFKNTGNPSFIVNVSGIFFPWKMK